MWPQTILEFQIHWGCLVVKRTSFKVIEHTPVWSESFASIIDNGTEYFGGKTNLRIQLVTRMFWNIIITYSICCSHPANVSKLLSTQQCDWNFLPTFKVIDSVTTWQWKNWGCSNDSIIFCQHSKLWALSLEYICVAKHFQIQFDQPILHGQCG